MKPMKGCVVGGISLLLILGSCTEKQEPAPISSPAPTSTPRAERPKEEKFRLLTHCGLSYPLTYERQPWLPVEKRYRRTHNPPRGFESERYYDVGTIRRVDDDTIVYTSSMGVEVEYEPTRKKGHGCK